jgi:hypothetical protein
LDKDDDDDSEYSSDEDIPLSNLKKSVKKSVKIRNKFKNKTFDDLKVEAGCTVFSSGKYLNCMIFPT